MDGKMDGWVGVCRSSHEKQEWFEMGFEVFWVLGSKRDIILGFLFQPLAAP